MFVQYEHKNEFHLFFLFFVGLVGTEQKDLFSFLHRKIRYSQASVWSASTTLTHVDSCAWIDIHSTPSAGRICLNGGTSIPSLSGEHMFCACAEGFKGKRCETGEDCHLTVTLLSPYSQGTCLLFLSSVGDVKWLLFYIYIYIYIYI